MAARLQQAAAPGEILVGAQTLALARGRGRGRGAGAARAEGEGGAGGGVPAARRGRGAGAFARGAVRRAASASSRCSGTPGRARSKAARCELVTVVGEPGVGQVAAGRGARRRARCPGRRRGRCLSYGEGITYCPVVEVIKQLGTLPADPAAAAALRSLLGESDAPTSPDEIAWAFRKLLEQSGAAARRVRRHPVGRGDVPRSRRARRAASRPARRSCSSASRGPSLRERRPQWPVALAARAAAGRQTSTQLLPDASRPDCGHGSRAPPAATRCL